MVSSAFAADKAQLNKVSFEERDGKTLIHLEMNKAADFGSIETRFLRRTAEFDLKNVDMKKDKIFTDIGAGDVNNVYISHNDENSVRVRVNFETGKMASNYNERISYIHADRRLSFILDSSIALFSNDIKELNRVYDVAGANDKKIAEHMNKASVLKVDGAGSATAAGDAAQAAADGEDEMISLDENKAEKDIPLNIKAKGNKEVSSSSLTRVMVGIAALSLMLFSVVIIGRKMNKKRLGAAFNHDSITVISQKYLGPKRNLTMVRVAGEYMLLGVTDHNISLIKTLSVVDDEIPSLTPNDFGAAVKDLTAKTEELEHKVQAAAHDYEIEDSFTVSSLNDVKKSFRKRRYIDE